MYDNNSQKDWVAAAVTAGIGAGIPATFAVSMGQNPLIALMLTGCAIVTALIIDHYC
ncbi:hypothetical protein [Leptolyngbya ohadii]|uniref:hypothetical protein n=1 Tax=Leptolyngbya ohadii TaxID=1962290 RepID=UPI0015C63F2E|nr:hypothetical protein [Leptolyngbya ohadii]